MKIITTIRNFSKNHKKLLIISMLVILIVAGACAYFLTRDGGVFEDASEAQRYYSKLTGEQVSKQESERPILGVMIENSEEARPQTGLDSAGIVFETTTEGGITRFLALYQDNLPEEVGPIRSVRPAFVDWLMGFDASVAHVGGSQEALDLLDDRSAKSLNQFFNDEPYYRSDQRDAPHNVYAKTLDLMGLINKKGFRTEYTDQFTRADAQAVEQPDATEINVTFSAPIFATQYVYTAESNTYTRHLAGEPHIDAATDKPITVNTLVVLEMGTTVGGIGNGKAYVFRNGTVEVGRWEKTGFASQLELTKVVDGQKQPLALSRGQTWIAGIPDTGDVSY